ncbi:MAG: uroporphyrinogen-III C-methyltransferase [Gammaproteobacteria bacterium]
MAEPTIKKETPARKRIRRARSSALPGALAAAAMLIGLAGALLGAAALWPGGWLGGVVQSGAARERIAAGAQRMQLATRLDQIEQRVDALPDPRAAFAREFEDIERARRVLRIQLETLRDTLQRDQAAGELERAESGREVRALTAALADLRAQTLRGADRFRLAEVEHLLLLARRQLQFAGDAALALRALELAEQRLEHFPGAAYRPVRIALAADIAALAAHTESAAGKTDTGALLRALAELVTEADALPLPDPAAPPPALTLTPQPGESWWRALRRDVFADLASLVRIDNAAARAPLTPELRRAMRERAKLILESAVLALLRGRGDLYALRLQAAHAHVSATFAADELRVRAFLAELEALSARAPVRPPDIASALQILRETMRVTAQ